MTGWVTELAAKDRTSVTVDHGDMLGKRQYGPQHSGLTSQQARSSRLLTPTYRHNVFTRQRNHAIVVSQLNSPI